LSAGTSYGNSNWALSHYYCLNITNSKLINLLTAQTE
jgi:hypothetical protein